ncbi:hypothetical protein R6V09_08165 [Streptomyces sp. W16]|uniref:hypothetical protein n=1 Tax=Streptomyces sp. W16 TaxID=3076631 RepID=UPI00295BCA0C|nr:hypothetical protein [Streptomyces sp. W16]MDV9170114.1 hypothetical protein [Streptomyces sp. W16]
MKNAIAAGALALVAAGSCLVLAPAASAAPDACVTSTLTTGSREGVGTQVRKSSTSSCSDLNLVYTDDKTVYANDGYAGRLYHTSTSSWKTCDAGYIWLFDGTYPVNSELLCTSVSDNTLFTVASAANGGDTVKVVH